MIKLLGSIVILTACGMAGMTVAKNYLRRPQELRALQSALQMLETEISYAASPLAEALGLVASRCDKSVSLLFSRTRDELIAMSGNTAKEAWDLALASFYQQSALNEADFSILSSLGSIIGVSDREDQIKHLSLTRAQLKAEMDKAEDLAGKNVKVWNYLGFFGGVVVVLILF